ncbi:MAG: SCO family protein [Flavobacteriales bacterium]
MKERQKRRSNYLMLVLLLAFTSCNFFNKHSDKEASLPFIGLPEFTENGDTIQYSIPKFSFINQDSLEVSHLTMRDKIFVADFFFTTCPSICPMLSSQMARLQGKVNEAGFHDQVRFLSHTVDPNHDLPDTLKAFASLIGADLSNWDFVTGKAEDIYYQAEKGYLLSAFPSDSADGGFFHTDKIALIDKQLHIRGLYDGTSTKEVDQLFNDIKILLHE